MPSGRFVRMRQLVMSPGHVMICLAALLPGCWAKTAPETIYIGHIAPRSGTDAERGLVASHAILLAVEDANAADTQGRQAAVIHTDAVGDVDKAEAAAVRLVTMDRVAGLLGSVAEPQTERLSRVARQYSVPMLSTTSLPNQSLLPFGFSVSPAAAPVGRALGKFVRENLKTPPVLLIAGKASPGGLELAEAFAKEFEKHEHDLRKRILASARDVQKEPARDELKQQLDKAVNEKPGVVVLLGSVADIRQWLELLVEAKLPAEVPLVLGTLESENPDLQSGLDLQNPVYRATPFVPEAGRAQDFAKRFQERFKKTVTAEAALSYDAASVLFEALRRAKSVQGSKVRDELIKLKDYECLTGPLSFDKDQCARRPVFIVRTADGKETREARYEAEPAPP